MFLNAERIGLLLTALRSGEYEIGAGILKNITCGKVAREVYKNILPKNDDDMKKFFETVADAIERELCLQIVEALQKENEDDTE
jgi:hypothetical protein